MLALRPAVLATVATVALLALPAAASAAGTWEPESYLAVGLQEASGPSIAVAANGGAIAGWQQNQPPFGEVDAVLTSRAPGTAPFATGGTPQGVASANAHDLGDMRTTTAVNSSGKAVSCSEPVGGACTVTLTFKAKKLVAASRTLTVAGGKSATPTLKLHKKAKRQLAKKGKLALKGTVVVRDAAGNARTFSVKTTLKPKKRR